MISQESVKYSLKNLWQRKSRSFLTILSIFIGITTIFIFISFGLGLYNYTNGFISDSSADKVTIMAKGGGAPGLDDTFGLTDNDIDAIEKTSGVYDVARMYSGVVEARKGSEQKYTFILGIDPEKFDLIKEFSSIEVQEGRALQKGEDKKVVLGYNYMLDKKIFDKGLELNNQIKINGESFRIVGFMGSVGNPQDDSQIYITAEAFENLYPNKKGKYSWVVARVDTSNIPIVIERIEKNLRKSRDLEEGKEDFFVSSFEDLLKSYTGALNIIIGFVILIALISVLVSAINTANTMITSVLERRKEIGVLKSIGARNREIFKIFLFESAFLGFVSGAIGVALGFIITYSAGMILENLGWGFLSPYYSFGLFLGCILFATVTGAISGAIPAYRASRINPVDALRYE